MPVALLAVAIRLWIGPQTVDDAYITFRYARNIAEGLGFVYNVGERVLGTTAPLYALLMAGAFGFGLRDLPWVSLAVNALCDSATTALLFWLTLRLGLGWRWALLVSVLFALSPLSVAFAVGGMESSVFTLLLMVAVAASVARRPTPAALAASLAALTRPEGLLMVGLVFGGFLLGRRVPSRGTVIACLLPLLPWVAFATWWFGSPVPQTLIAKTAVYKVPLGENLFNLLMWTGPPGAVAIFAVITFGYTIIKWLGGRWEVLPLFAFAPLVVAGYLVAGLRGARMFHWYVVPLVPFALLATVAVCRKGVPQKFPMAGLVLASALLLASFGGLNLGRDPARPAFAPIVLDVTREGGYTAAAQFLAPRVSRDDVVALPEIGAFGYNSDAHVLDLVGLVSPEAIAYYPLPGGLSADNGVPVEFIRRRRPDFVVGLDQYLSPLANSVWFQNDYTLLTSFDAQIWRSCAVLVYGKREDAP